MGNPAHPALRLCKTLVSCPGRAASTGAHVTRAGAALYAVSGSAPARPALGSTPGTPDSGTACGTFPEPRGGRAGWVGEGPANRRGGCQAPRLRAGRPAIQLSRRARFRAPLVHRARLGQWGANREGRPGAAEPMSEASQVKGAGLGSKGPSAGPGEGGGRGLAGVARGGGREEKRGSGAVGLGPGNAGLP